MLFRSDRPGGPRGPGGPSGPSDLLTGSWQDAECKCLLEILAVLAGAVRNLSVLLGGMNIFLMLNNNLLKSPLNSIKSLYSNA